MVELACPPQLPPLRDSSFGATTEALLDASATYFQCREAALSCR